MNDKDVILKVDHLNKTFKVKSSQLFGKPAYLKAVNDVSFEVHRGETIGIIGESGCGKSTLGKSILRLIEPTSGDVVYNGKSLMGLERKEMNALRQEINMVFQDPYSSLDPRMTTGDLIEEPMIIHNIGTPEERKKRVQELLKLVGLDYYHAIRYPHEFSGGQRQRINIARALAMNVKLLVCDEPVSALDVSVQAQVLNLLKELKDTLGLTYIFISHDLSVVKYISDRIIIMYLGKIMEMGEAEEIYKNPAHPYTRALFSAIPPVSPFETKEEVELSGEIPSPLNMPPGCPFGNRCPYCTEECRAASMELQDIGEGHKVACVRYLKGEIQ
ncbi:oligopeptide/dipeptide ABC transporter ATP-binding protein [Roseburia hominis]